MIVGPAFGGLLYASLTVCRSRQKARLAEVECESYRLLNGLFGNVEREKLRGDGRRGGKWAPILGHTLEVKGNRLPHRYKMVWPRDHRGFPFIPPYLQGRRQELPGPNREQTKVPSSS